MSTAAFRTAWLHPVTTATRLCKFACLGLGTCARVCPFDAIHVDPVKKIAVVDDAKCVACGKCVAICPKGVLSLRPVTDVTVRCRNTEPAKKVLSACSTGCIHCGKCFRSCPHGAITMTNGLPVIDQSKCQHCMACARTLARQSNVGELRQAEGFRVIWKLEKDVHGCEELASFLMCYQCA